MPDILYSTQYRNNLELALQQVTSKLAPHAVQMKGSNDFVEVNAQQEAALPRRKRTRHQALGLTDGRYVRRWAPRREPYYYDDSVDREDMTALKVDLTSTHVKSGAAVIARSRDMAFLEGLFGPNMVGERHAPQQVLLPASQIVPVDQGAATPTGLTVEKLAVARTILMANEVDLDVEEAYVAITSKQYGQLLQHIQLQSSDYNTNNQTVMRNGKLVQLMGFNFVQMEFQNAGTVGPEIAAMSADSNGNRRLPFWVKSGMAMVTWEDMFARVSEIPERSYSTQVYASTQLTGTRTSEQKVGFILASEA